jgi:hypothetical protein
MYRSQPLLLKAIRAAGLSVAEFCVLTTLFDAPASRLELPRIVTRRFVDDGFRQSEDDYREAIEICRRREWIRELTAEEIARRRSILTSEGNPNTEGEVTGAGGDVDLSDEGYACFRKAGSDCYPLRGMRAVSEKALIEIYSREKADGLELALFYINGRTYPFDAESDAKDYVFAEASYPRECGPWRYSRFERVEGGYVLTLRYQKAVAGA